MGQSARILAVGNEKGAAGKTTAAIHLAVELLYRGRRVACLDLDVRHKSLRRVIESRKAFAEHEKIALPMPWLADLPITEGAGEAPFAKVFEDLGSKFDVIILDTPGGDSDLCRLACSFADILLTPLDGGLAGLDVLAQIDRRGPSVIGPSHYAESVFQQKIVRAARDGGSINWVVACNRLGCLDGENKQEMARLFGELSRRLGFRAISGLSNRAVFRKLFSKGLTVADLRRVNDHKLSILELAARQDVRFMIKALKL